MLMGYIMFMSGVTCWNVRAVGILSDSITIELFTALDELSRERRMKQWIKHTYAVSQE